MVVTSSYPRDSTSAFALVTDIANCTVDTVWAWEHTAQCLDTVPQMVGFALACTAVILCTTTYASRYYLQQGRQRQPFQNGLFLVTTFNLLSDVLGFTGAFLLHLLPTQIVFAGGMLFSSSFCCIHYMCNYCSKHHDPSSKKIGKHQRRLIKRSTLKHCMYPLYLLFPALTLAGLSPLLRQHLVRDDNSTTMNHTVMPAGFLLGYMLGVMAAISLLCAKLLETFMSYTVPADWGRKTYCIHGLSIVGDLSYYVGVYMFNVTEDFIFLTLPWTLPRLLSAGLEAGNITQHCLTSRKRRHRHLSKEDADPLLSSDLDISSDDSEEIVWMPLQTLQCVQPQYTTCQSRVQVKSETDPYFGVAELADDPANTGTTNKTADVSNGDVVTIQCHQDCNGVLPTNISAAVDVNEDDREVDTHTEQLESTPLTHHQP